MEKILTLAVLIVAASVWFISAGYSSAGPGVDPWFSPNPVVPDPQALVCYDVQQGDNEMADVVLETKTYGQDEVEVRKLIMLCELSNMYTFDIPTGLWFYVAPNPPTVADTSILACYELQNGDDPGMGAYLTTQSFGTDQVLIDTSNVMCESAKKHVTNRDGTVSTFGTATNIIFQCFDIANGDDPNLAVAFANNNFGDEPVILGAGIGMCEEGVKYREVKGQIEVTGMANGIAYECFDIAAWQDDRHVAVTIETENFGFDDVTVRQATQLCQIAKKGDFHVITAYPHQP
jgi:hypothetical protein